MVHQRVLVFLVSLFFIKATLSTDSIPIPLESLSVAAESPYDLGFQEGVYRKESIQAFIANYSYINDTLLPWYETHTTIYDAYVSANTGYYPDIFNELEGLADGAEVNFTVLMLLALSPEIGQLLNIESDNSNIQQCSDVLVHDLHGMTLLAHNEDGDGEYWAGYRLNFHTVTISGSYLLVAHQLYNDNSDTNAARFTAFTYTAHFSGFASGWNDYIVYSCNALPPDAVVVGGRARYFINRVDDAVTRATLPNISLGFSINIAGIDGGRVLNIETHSTGCDIYEVTSGNYYEHTNEYLRMDVAQHPGNSTQHRDARMQAMGEPHSISDDTQWPIYRDGVYPDTDSYTLVTILYDLGDRTVSIFRANPKDTPALDIFSLPIVSNSTNHVFEWLFIGTIVVALILVVLLVALLVAYKRKSQNYSQL